MYWQRGIFVLFISWIMLSSGIFSFTPSAIASNENNKNTENLSIILSSKTGDDKNPNQKIKDKDPYPNISKKVSQNILKTMEIPAGHLNLKDPKFQIKVPVYIYLDKDLYL